MLPHNPAWPELHDYYPHWVRYRAWHQRVPGVQFALRHNGELIASAAYGVSDETTGAALTESHLFRIASHSKTIAAVLVLQLVEQGRVRLDDSIASHLSGLAASPLRERTIGELLAHGGGVIRDGEDGDFWQSHRPFPDRDELLAVAAAGSSATIARNEHFKYSNIAFGLLGLVIRAVTGADYPDRVRTHIATPLALTDLGGELDPARRDDYAAPHSGVAHARERQVLPHVDTGALAAATGAYATARDLTAFFSALLPGRTELLSADSQRQQRLRRWEVDDGKRWYGLGMFLDRIADTDLFGHTGGYPGHITATFADADSGWVVSAFTNAVDGPASQLASGWFRLRGLARDADHAACDDSAARFTGRFASLWGVLDIVRLDGRLFAVHPTDADPAESAAALEVENDTTLRIVGGQGGNSYGETMPFVFGTDGQVLSMRADSGMTMTPFDGELP